ncbi:MAG: 4-hydroxy-tetrahydrodipicolinate reductase [Clostridia bacterium]|nr:4-hydroxy-tetrahydrodipicolinate reductase [Clostridia bacterium]
MTRIILNGCGGKMGAAVTACASSKEDAQIVAGVDIRADVDRPYPVFSSFDEINGIEADVVVDFSNPCAFDSMLNYCLDKKIGSVVCTTGLSPEQNDKLKEAAKTIPLFVSGNMSIGVNLLIELAKTATKVLGNDFDIEIIEQHHNQKVDAPSGTAYMIADAINAELDNKDHYEYNRHPKREKRSPDEIGIHSIRGGTITGEHEVIFAGNDEIIKISHSARSKALFATGAVNAAIYTAGRNPGLYNMSDMLK